MTLASAFVAALVAHVAIDVAGDYLLAHDTYDDHAHGSRYVASIALAIAAIATLWIFVRAVLAETRAHAVRFMPRYGRRFRPRSPYRPHSFSVSPCPCFSEWRGSIRSWRAFPSTT